MEYTIKDSKLVRKTELSKASEVYDIELTTLTNNNTSKAYTFSMSELEVEYDFAKQEIISLILRDTSVHKRIHLFGVNKAYLYTVEGKDTIGENLDPVAALNKELIISLTINGKTYESPLSVESIYTDLLENAEDIPTEEDSVQFISPWTSASFTELSKALKVVAEDEIDNTVHEMKKQLFIEDKQKLIEDELLTIMKKTLIKAFNAPEQVSVEIIYEPNKLDAHNQWMSEDTIAKACENFNKNLETGNVKPNLYHIQTESEKLEILRTYILPCDCTIGETEVVKGTWVGEMKWHDDVLWAKRTVPQEDGTLEIAGVSIGSMGVVNAPTS